MIYFFFVFFSLFLNCASPAQEKDIWGIWNTSGKEYATSVAILSTGTYLYDSDDGDSLTFYKDYYNDGPRISYQGGHYKIDKIISKNNNFVELYTINEQFMFNEKNKLEKVKFFGKVIVHFIDDNQMWLELDYNDKEYPTDLDFNKSDFKGIDVIYWREKIK
jgi:hypothetical protein